ncbi:MAG TPA: nucleoside 2-deoxyribosyltransferase [Solirubrobacterales bacterium]|nr:nucleoside 2-deoxyribosyltransferase [Solirubrobacterales bacterium]
MDDHRINPDVASALTSAKSVFAIVNGLTLTNTVLVLITGGNYSEVIPLGELNEDSIVLAVVLSANIVRFYHGNVRHLDAAYGTESIASAASGRHVEPRGGLGLDFFIIFAQSLLFAMASFYINVPTTYILLFIVLLIFDALWTVYSQRTDGEFAGSPQRMWLLNNMVAAVFLGAFYLGFYQANTGRAWALIAAVIVLVLTTLIDFVLNWWFYFPRSIKKWHPGEPLSVFLSAPLTQYVHAEDDEEMDSFRCYWSEIIEALGRGGHDVFSAHQREAWGADIDSPESALRADIEALHKSDLVIAYIGDPPSPGVQMEIGYAMAHRKRVLIFIDQGQEEPYLVRGLPEFRSYEVVDIETKDDIKATLSHKGLIDAINHV